MTRRIVTRNRGRKKVTKKLYQFKHAKKRARQRYGLDLSDEVLNKMVKAINGDPRYANLCRVVEKQTNRVTVYAFKCNTAVCGEVPVVYDRQRKSIVSFLPPEYWNNHTPVAEDDDLSEDE